MDQRSKSEAVSPIKLLRLFEEAPEQAERARGLKHPRRQFAPLVLLPGETLILQQENVTCVGTLTNLATGVLYLSCYRLVFKGTFFQDSSIEVSGSKVDQEEIARRGYKYQKKRYELPKVNQHIKKIHSKIGQSVRKGGKLIQASIKKKRGNFLFNQYALENDDIGDDIESQAAVNLLGMRIGTHLAIQEFGINDSDTNGGAVADSLENVLISLPIVSIHDVKKFPKQYLEKEKLRMLRDGIEVTCNNLTSVKLCIGGSDNYDAEELLQVLEKHCCPQGRAAAFAYSYSANLKLPSSCRSILTNKSPQNFYKFDDEVKRLKLDTGNNVVTVDQSFCPRYPRRVVVPLCVRERDALREIADYHCNNCFPIVTWRCPRSSGFLLRSAIPRTARGLSDQRCQADEKYIGALAHFAKNRDTNVWVFTERGRVIGPSANNNQSSLSMAEGEAYYYPHCSFVFDDNLPDVQTVQQNGIRLMHALSNKTDESKYLSQLEESGWLENIRRLLEISTAIASEIENEGSAVVVAYDDGVDRTSQIVSLVQLLLDPFYRTLDGFQVLIQKEWLSVKHPFMARNLSTGFVDDNLSPIFLQFLDCVWQLCHQFPVVFQFNENLLQTLATHSYSGRFGTFLDFEKSKLSQIEPISFWTWLNVVIMARDDFVNPIYEEEENSGPIYPVAAAPWLELWSWYTRYRTEESLALAENVAYMQMEKRQKEFKERLAEHHLLLSEYSKLDEATADQYAFHTRSIGSILHKRTESCATNYSYHLENTEETKPRNILSSFFAKKAKSYENLNSLGSKDKIGKSTFYDGNDFQEEDKMKVRTFPRQGLIGRNPTNFRTALENKGIDYVKVIEVKVTEHTCSGYLRKQGLIRKSWHQRWFVLDVRKGCVAYFEDHVSDQPKGVFKCMLITQVYPNTNQEKHQNLFYIDTTERRYPVEAPNSHAMNVWLACFQSLL
ncbi:uncharacterized protein LOC135691154 isoform X2 [Rhopilema esculentum]|uniref:uncharacterized protein LOC135691154 isoform X1 n=1 Tax=Rhopilema esculentum TaxID=499914 RepID=UPI0031CE76C6